MKDKLKVLFLSASRGALRVDHELRAIVERIRRAPAGDQIELVSEWAVRTTDITDALLRHRPNVVHFSGHGRADAGIFLEDERGRPVGVLPDTMCRLFAPLRGTTRLVILNACETRPIAEALQYVVDYTISMRKPITDAAAIAFAAGFYGALAHRETVRSAFNSALTQLDLSLIPEADIPDLVEAAGAPVAPLVPEKRRASGPVRQGHSTNIQNTVGDHNTFGDIKIKVGS